MACSKYCFELFGRIGAHGGSAQHPSRCCGVFLDLRLEEQVALRVDYRTRRHPVGAGEDAVENLGALRERLVEREFTAGVNHVEDDIRDRHLCDQLLADLLASQPLLDFRERHGVTAVLVVTPGDDLAVENYLVRELAQRRDQFGKRRSYFVEGAREQPHLPAAAMRLGANAVVLVLDQGVLEILECLVGVGRRAGQHEADGMKQPHARFVEAMVSRQLQRAADVAQQHVGALHLRERLVIGLGDRFLDQALFQANAQLASDDLEDVLGFERSGELE